jgi:hypothetical protein
MQHITHTFLLLSLLVLIGCGGNSLEELTEQADQRTYTADEQQTDSNPMVFSPFQLVSLHLDWRYYQKAEGSDDDLLHEGWKFTYQDNPITAWSTSITGFDAQFGSNAPDIFDTVLWYLPRERVHYDSSLSFEETTQDSQRQIILRYTLPDGSTVFRKHIHPINATYEDYSGHDRDLKDYYADFIMLQAHVGGAERSAEGAIFRIGDRTFELKKSVGIVYSFEMKDVLISGVVAGTSIISPTQEGCSQQFNEGITRNFSITKESDEKLLLQTDNGYCKEIQRFQRRDQGWELVTVENQLVSGDIIRMKFDPPLYDYRFMPETPQRSLFTIKMGETGAIIKGEVEIKGSEDGSIIASLLPSDPSWCKRRPVHTRIKYTPEKMILSAQIENLPEEIDDEFDF